MPKLLVFAPCERAILDDQKNATLVVILQYIAVSVSKGEEIPKNAVTPKEWAVFTLWQPLAEDIGKEFTQFVQTILPDGSEFKKTELKFRPEPDKVQQVRLNILGFPVGQVGTLTLNMWLEVDSQRVGDVHTYHLTVTHVREAPSTH